MSKLTIFIFIFFILISCSEATIKDRKDISTPDITLAKSNRPHYKDISEVVGEKEILNYWISPNSYYPTLHFDNPDTLYLEFNGQCQYSYPYKKEGENIIVHWDYIENCTHDIGIKKSFNLKSSPVKGKPFMTLRLVSDTAMQATYLHQEWVSRFNKEYPGYKYLPESFISVGH
jgi:hypothetical protein